jgi:hypothetical protein
MRLRCSFFEGKKMKMLSKFVAITLLSLVSVPTFAQQRGGYGRLRAASLKPIGASSQMVSSGESLASASQLTAAMVANKYRQLQASLPNSIFEDEFKDAIEILSDKIVSIETIEEYDRKWKGYLNQIKQNAGIV